MGFKISSKGKISFRTKRVSYSNRGGLRFRVARGTTIGRSGVRYSKRVGPVVLSTGGTGTRISATRSVGPVYFGAGTTKGGVKPYVGVRVSRAKTPAGRARAVARGMRLPD